MMNIINQLNSESLGFFGVDLHIHSTFSDGQNTPEEIVDAAIQKGYKMIAVVDHVRRTSDWIESFADEINRLKLSSLSKIRLFSGIEAKVINLDGDIDAKPEFFPKVDLVLGAFHRIPVGQGVFLRDEEIPQQKEKALNCWFNAMMRLIENPFVNIIAHPEATLKRHDIKVPYDMKEAIARKAASSNKIFEMNLKYQVPEEEFLRLLIINKVKLCTGSDSHSVAEIRDLLTGENVCRSARQGSAGFKPDTPAIDLLSNMDFQADEITRAFRSIEGAQAISI